MTLRNYSTLFAGETVKSIDLVCHDDATRVCRIERYTEGFVAFLVCVDGDYTNHHPYASAANALRAAATWRDLPATPAPAIEQMTDADLISEYTAIFNACSSVKEIADVVSIIEFATLNGDTVAAITSAYEAARGKLIAAETTYDVRIGIVGPRRGSNTFVGDMTLSNATLDAAQAEVAKLYRIGAAAVANIFLHRTSTRYVAPVAPQAIIEAPADVIADNDAPIICIDCGDQLPRGFIAGNGINTCRTCHDKRGALPLIPLIDQQRAQLIDRAIATGKTFTDQMLINFPLTRKIALDYVREYTGTNTFIISLNAYMDRNFTLTPAQMRGALNAMVADAKIARYENSDRLSKADALAFDARYNDGGSSAVAEYYADLRSKEDKALDAAGDVAIDLDAGNEVTPLVPNGIYTVSLSAADAAQSIDTYRTLRVKTAPDYFKGVKAGTQIVQFLNGADNENDYTTFAFLTGNKIGIWRSFTKASDLGAALRRLVADPMGAAGEYVRRSGKCFVCNRTLTVPESLAGGIGPVCKAKVEALGFTFKLEPSAHTKARATMPAAQAQREIDELF